MLDRKNYASPLHIFSKPVTVPVLVTAIPVILLIDSDTVNWQLQNVSNQSRNYLCHRACKIQMVLEKHRAPIWVQVQGTASFYWTELDTALLYQLFHKISGTLGLINRHHFWYNFRSPYPVTFFVSLFISVGYCTTFQTCLTNKWLLHL